MYLRGLECISLWNTLSANATNMTSETKTSFLSSTNAKRAFPEPALLTEPQLDSLQKHGSIGFQKTCMNCGCSAEDKSKKNKKKSTSPHLIPCPKCNSVWYCSNQCMHKDSHHREKICQFLHLMTSPQQTKHPRNIIQEFNEIFHRRLAVDDESDVLQHTGREREIDSFFQKRYVDNMYMQHLLSYPLTIALVTCKNQQLVLDRHMKRNRDHIENKNAFVCHIVGASQEETEYPLLWRELHNALLAEYSQMLKSTQIYFIGPEVKTMHAAQKVRKHNYFGNTLQLTSIKSKYHHVFEKRTTQLPVPDLIVLFQPDLSNPDYKWNSTLLKIAELGRPVLITSQCQSQLLVDVKKLLRKKFGFQGMIAPTENPYASPCVIQSDTVANDIYRKNSYYALLFPQESKSSK